MQECWSSLTADQVICENCQLPMIIAFSYCIRTLDCEARYPLVHVITWSLFSEEKVYPEVAVSDFPAHVEAMHADSDFAFSQEFEVRKLLVLLFFVLCCSFSTFYIHTSNILMMITISRWQPFGVILIANKFCCKLLTVQWHDDIGKKGIGGKGNRLKAVLVVSHILVRCRHE